MSSRAGRGPGQLQDDGDDEERQDAERDVDVEAPAPGGVVGEEAAEQRPGDGGQSEGGADQAHVAAALPGRYDIGHDRLDADHEAAAADALDGAEDDQFVHRARPARQRRADDEDENGEDEDRLAAEEVTELAVEGQTDGRGQQVGRHRPGHLVQTVQFADDLRQGGGDDGLVERREQQRQHQADEDQPHPAGAELDCGCAGGGRRGLVARRGRSGVLVGRDVRPRRDLAGVGARSRAGSAGVPEAGGSARSSRSVRVVPPTYCSPRHACCRRPFLASGDNRGSSAANRRVRGGTDTKYVARGAYWAPIRGFCRTGLTRSGHPGTSETTRTGEHAETPKG